MCGMILNKASIQIQDSTGNVIDTAKEETLQEVKLVLQDVAKETTLQEVAKETTLQSVAKDTTLQAVAKEETLQEVKTVLQGIARETTLQGVAKDTTLHEVAKEITLQDIKAKTDKLSFDGSNNLLIKPVVEVALEPTQLEVKRHLDNIDFSVNDRITTLKFSGSYTSGTYTITYTPASGEVVYIDMISLNTYTGKGELKLLYGSEVIGWLSLDSNKVFNAKQHIKRKVIGDGSIALTLQLIVGANGNYFGNAILWRVR